MESAFPAIGDYAVIGNCRTAALVSRDGALEWLCLPTFSGAPLFGALLDGGAGLFSIRAHGDYRVQRRYVHDTNVLQTDFHCTGGAELRHADLPRAGPRAQSTAPRGVRRRRGRGRSLLRATLGLRPPRAAPSRAQRYSALGDRMAQERCTAGPGCAPASRAGAA